MKRGRGRPPIPGLRCIAIRIFLRDIRIARRVARQEKTGYQAVVRRWIAEKASAA